MRTCVRLELMVLVLVVGTVCSAQSTIATNPRIIELTAGPDSRYRLGGKVAPTIEVRAGEPLILRIFAVRAKTVARDGSVHGLALLDNKSDAMTGWKFFLHPGLQDLVVSAPPQPGRYTAVCTIICSDAHDGMGFTLLVVEQIPDEKVR